MVPAQSDTHRSALPMQVATIPRDLCERRIERCMLSYGKDLTVGEADTDLIKKWSYQRLISTRNDEIHAFTLVFSSNLPLGVRSMMLGGRNGYSAGSRIRKWYNPPSKSVPAGPRRVQCHS